MSKAKELIKGLLRFGTAEQEARVVELARAVDPSEGPVFQSSIQELNRWLKRKPDKPLRSFVPTPYQQTLYKIRKERNAA